ncbi:MAG: hydrogenase maturation protease [Anaerolineae bacterium]
MARILIIGYGNPLRGDDGAGWQIAERFQETLRVSNDARELEVLVCHQLTPDLAEPISRADRVLFIDAAEQGSQVGYAVEPVVPTGIAPGGFTHHVNPAALLTLAQALYGRAPQADALIVNGVSFGYGETLSPAVAALVPQTLERIEVWCADSNISQKDS